MFGHFFLSHTPTERTGNHGARFLVCFQGFVPSWNLYFIKDFFVILGQDSLGSNKTFTVLSNPCFYGVPVTCSLMEIK